MLSTGQRLVIESKSNVDGSPATPNHLSHVRQAIKVKVLEASADLQFLHDKDPEIRALIDRAFDWLNQSPRGRKAASSAKKAEPEKDSHALPDLDIESLPEVKIDPGQVRFV